MASKRAWGMANLYIKGRVHHFHTEIARSAIASVLDESPDAVVISGDLTALASPAEFELALDNLKPLLESLPVFIVPGNHDCYTRQANKTQRIREYFGPYLHYRSDAPGEYPTEVRLDDVVLLGMNPCRFHIGSSGRILEDELKRLEARLAALPRHLFRILVIHYPILNRHGKPNAGYWRRLEGAEDLRELLLRQPVNLLLHGHDHMRYLNILHPSQDSPIYLYNSGSAAFDRGSDYPIHASYNLYEIEEGRLAKVIHKDWNGNTFISTYEGPPLIPESTDRAPHDTY